MSDKSLPHHSSPVFAFRSDVTPADCANVREIVAATGFFSPAETEMAVELVEENLKRGAAASGYNFIFADADGRTWGYACFGPIDYTAGSFDLFWIAVHPDFRRRGLGRRILRLSEEAIRAMGGARIFVETSGRAQYEPTREFYARAGYRRQAVLDDFYGSGDDKVIYELKL